MGTNSKTNVKAIVSLASIIAVLLVSTFAAFSEEEQTKYKELEKEEIAEESQDDLKEYYGELLGNVNTKNAKFNTIASKDNIAIINVTIEGRDKRILTRLHSGTLYSGWQQNPYLFTTTNLVVLGNITLKGELYKEIYGDFGLRRVYSAGSSRPVIIDEGFSRLYRGTANISITPVLRELIETYNVFLSPEGLTKGIYIAEKTSSYFIVKSLNPASSIAFSWMLRGTKKGFDEYLSSYTAKNTTITAEINYANHTAVIRIERLYNYSIEGIEKNSSNRQSNSTANLSILTGNIILEENLSEILEDLPQQLPSLNQSPTTNEDNTSNEDSGTQENSNTQNNTIQDNATNEAIETPIDSGNDYSLEFTLYSTDENYIIEKAAEVSGLGISDVKMVIKFVYKAPENFEDEIIEEIIEEKPTIDFMEKVNGSIVVKLG